VSGRPSAWLALPFGRETAAAAADSGTRADVALASANAFVGRVVAQRALRMKIDEYVLCDGRWLQQLPGSSGVGVVANCYYR
jgi:hypothetical protein